MLAVSKETILKSNLPSERPASLISESMREGRRRCAHYGLSRTLFLLRMDSQRRNLTSNQLYWQMAGAVIEDTMRGLRDHLHSLKQIGISGYIPLAEAWAETLSHTGIATRIFSENDLEDSFCTGLGRIVACWAR